MQHALEVEVKSTQGRANLAGMSLMAVLIAYEVISDGLGSLGAWILSLVHNAAFSPPKSNTLIMFILFVLFAALCVAMLGYFEQGRSQDQ